MNLRTAALYGHDPGAERTSAEMLALRGVHPTVESAEAALAAVREKPLPDKPTHRRSLRTWVHCGYLALVFGGFLSPSTGGGRPSGTAAWLRTAAGLVAAGLIWAITWVLPVSFMIAMAWGCESHTRQLGRRTLTFYDGDAATSGDAIAIADRTKDRGHDRRQALRAIALGISLAVPIGFVAYANHIRQSTGVNWVVALGALVAMSLVIGTIVVGGRR